MINPKLGEGTRSPYSELELDEHQITGTVFVAFETIVSIFHRKIHIEVSTILIFVCET